MSLSLVWGLVWGPSPNYAYAPGGREKVVGFPMRDLVVTKYVIAFFFAFAIAHSLLFQFVIDLVWFHLFLTLLWVPAPSDWISMTAGLICGFGMAFLLWRYRKTNRLVARIMEKLLLRAVL
jgi:hypothetical protein